MMECNGHLAQLFTKQGPLATLVGWAWHTSKKNSTHLGGIHDAKVVPELRLHLRDPKAGPQKVHLGPEETVVVEESRCFQGFVFFPQTMQPKTPCPPCSNGRIPVPKKLAPKACGLLTNPDAPKVSTRAQARHTLGEAPGDLVPDQEAAEEPCELSWCVCVFLAVSPVVSVNINNAFHCES